MEPDDQPPTKMVKMTAKPKPKQTAASEGLCGFCATRWYGLYRKNNRDVILQPTYEQHAKQNPQFHVALTRDLGPNAPSDAMSPSFWRRLSARIGINKAPQQQFITLHKNFHGSQVKVITMSSNSCHILRWIRFLPWSFLALAGPDGTTQEKILCDVAVIGGGVVGLSVARFCAVQGASVVLLEKEDTVAAGASSGNSGLGCTGYDAPVGSLERKLLRRSIQLHPHLYRSFGLSGDHVRKCGSLVVAWTPEQLQKLPHVLAENQEAGDTDAYLMDQQELRKFEPGLSPEALGAVYCPHEAIVEPWLVPMGYAESATIHGAKILTNIAVTSARFNPVSDRWILGLDATTGFTSLGRSVPGQLLTEATNASKPAQTQPQELHAKIVINCGGLFGDLVEKFRDPAPPQSNDFLITPRKGQFVVFKPKDSSPHPPPDAIIEPVATQFTKGVIAWTTLYGNIIVGPTAVDQTSRTDRSTDPATIEELRKWGEKILPAVRDAQVIGTYSGLRPATEHRDYQIRSYPDQKWISVNGIRSTGLTCSPAIGEYVSELVLAIQQPGYKPWAEQTTEGVNLLGVNDAKENLIVPCSTPNPKVPSLKELSEDYQKQGDGTVALYSKRYRVTHPLSSFGMESFTPVDE